VTGYLQLLMSLSPTYDHIIDNLKALFIPVTRIYIKLYMPHCSSLYLLVMRINNVFKWYMIWSSVCRSRRL